ERQIPRFQAPGCIFGDIGRRFPPARLDRPARGQALPAVAVVGTGAVEWIRVPVVRDAHVPELRVHQPVEELPLDQTAAADAGAHRYVAGRVEPLRRAPAMFAERGRVDVRVESNRNGQAAPNLLAEVGLRPAGFRRRRYVSPGRGGGVAVQGPERADSDRVDGPFALEEGDGLVDRGRGSRRRDRIGRSKVVRAGADGAFPLRAPGLDAAVDGQAAPSVRAPHDRRTVNRPGRTTTFSWPGPRPWIRSRSSCVPSVPNLSAGCSSAVRKG